MAVVVTQSTEDWATLPWKQFECNVYRLHGFYNPTRLDEIAADCRAARIGCVDCKRMFAENLITYFAPFRERRARLSADPDYVWDILAEGARRASRIASEVIAEVKEAIGLPERR